MALRNGRTHAFLAEVVVAAFDSRARRQGLLGKNALPVGHAVALAPCNAVHTFFMRFAIDVVFVRHTGEVTHIAHGVRPWRIAVSMRAHAVVELPAGVARSSDTRAGDVLELVPREA
jgi:hypothetical protein